MVNVRYFGPAELAFVAAPQEKRLRAAYVLPLSGIAPDIPQGAALLSDTEAARAFWDWLAQPAAAALIAADGYLVP